MKSLVKVEIEEKAVQELAKKLESLASKHIYPLIAYCGKINMSKRGFLKALNQYPELENSIIRGELTAYEEAVKKYNLFKDAFMFDRNVTVQVGNQTHEIAMSGAISKMQWIRIEFEEFKNRFFSYSLVWRRERVSRRKELADAITESSVDDFLAIKQKMISEIDRKVGIDRKSSKDLTWNEKHLEVVDEEIDISHEIKGK